MWFVMPKFGFDRNEVDPNFHRLRPGDAVTTYNNGPTLDFGLVISVKGDDCMILWSSAGSKQRA